MKHRRYQSIVAMCLTFLMLLSVLLVVSPPAAGAVWRQESDTDFSGGTLLNVEIIGVGPGATVQLTQDMLSWVDRAPFVSPSPRQGHAMAYDSMGGVTVLFGGYDGVTYFGDTWEYDYPSNTWTQIITPGPSPREGAAMAYDSANAVVVLFGGLNTSGTLDDTWEYNVITNTWTEIFPPSSPGTMLGHDMVYDTVSFRIVVVGRDDKTGLFETWAYRADTNIWLQRNPLVSPPARNRFGLAFHQDIGRTVLYGGALGMTGYHDTWEYNYSADAWAQTLSTGPDAFIETAMVYHASNNSVYLYGGTNETGGYPIGTWRYYYDMGTPTWVMLFTPSEPMGRSYHDIVYDSANDVSIFFGGIFAAMYWGDTWALGMYYQMNGALRSSTLDTLDTETVWGNIWWNDTPAAQPPGAVLKFHIGTYNFTGEPFDFVGPDGTIFTYYEIGSGEPIYLGQRGRYLEYIAYFETIDFTVTPVFDDIDITYNIIPADPMVILTNPSHGEFGVNRDRNITIHFNEPMNTASVTVNINPSLTVNRVWQNSDTTLILTHAQLMAEAQVYTVTVTGNDLAGNPLQAGPVPNPFNFITLADDPKVSLTDPAHMETDVPVNYIITVDFSEPMNASTVNWTITPSLGLSPSWNGDNTTLQLSHVTDFTSCTDYTVEITEGEDLIGNVLVPGPVPNPWDFKSVCLFPFITFTDPVDETMGVVLDYPINVTFSEEMNPATLTWDITPLIALTPGWQAGNTEVVFSHVDDFVDCLTYTMNITYVEDLGGDPLGPGLVPNPWTFTAACPNPQIASTDPYDGEIDVELDRDITVGFSRAMDTASVKWDIDPSVTFTSSWVLNQVLTLSHATPFGECTQYQMTITWGNDSGGNPLVPGPVPNPWVFNTICDNPVVSLTDPYDGEANVAFTRDIVVTFSEVINTTSVNWSISPAVVMTESWEVGDTVLRLQHAVPFADSTLYDVRINEAKDLDGNDLVPGPVPNPWSFTTILVGPDPQIVETLPANGTSDIPLDQTLIVNFSEQMDTLTVTVNIDPVVPLSPSWTNGDQTLTLTHAVDFTECTKYTVTVAGKDMDGNDLVAGPVPNPFVFNTICVSPQISSTFPVDGDIDVALNVIIQVVFTEDMNVSSVGWLIAPVVGLSETWTDNKTLFLDPVVNLTDCTAYTVTISGSDPDGNPLIPNPAAPNPWTFTTTCLNPFITQTDPYDTEVNVELDRNITIDFSEAIDTATFQWTIFPDEGLVWIESWSPGNMSVELRHVAPFTQTTTYTVTVTQANDTDGDVLVAGPVPNPWDFTTLSLVPPYIVQTLPADLAIMIPLDYNIRIWFSEPMDTGTVTWDIFPPVGGLGWTWELGDTLLNITHTVDFLPLTTYEVNVTGGKDTTGQDLVPGPVPNPWTFTTGMIANPFIVSTIPADLQTGVALDANVTIVFSEEIDTATFLWDIIPDPTGWTPVWMLSNTMVNLTHTVDFDPLTIYMVTVIQADDLDGNPLIAGPVPNPWNFTTGMADYPTVLSIDPFDGEIDVALDAEIIVTFSEPMNTATITWNIIPNPGGWLPDQWTGGDTILTLNHSNPFAECQSYQFMITNGQDLDGNDLVPLPFTSTFTTECFNPYIVSTDPFDAETNVEVTRSITVVFSEPMNTATVTWNIMPAIVLASSWPDSVTLVLSHPVDFDMCQRYDVNITGGDDLDGLPLIGGPVPNPWYFITECVLAAPSGLDVVRVFPNDVELTFNTSVGASSYHVYESSDRFAVFPGGWSMTDCAAPPCTLAGHLSDGLTHYYVVRAFDLGMGVESGNSTMGVKIQKDFSYNPATTNVYWMSLPYNSIYTKASDIANELTESNIRVVGKWDIAAQKTRLYYYLRGKWRGNDFNINPGDGIYVSTISAFNWYITGTDKDTTLSLVYSPSIKATNEHWISIPYTGTYAMASDIVIDIEGGTGPGTNTMIIEVGLWDPSTQGVITYAYTPTGWTGDFAISPGDGIYLKVVTSFNWQPKLITPEVP